MSYRYPIRQKPPLNYHESEEPSFDKYVFCEKCAIYVFEYCSIHGPLLFIPDRKIPAMTDNSSIIPRAALTIPHVFLHLATSSIPGAGIGVFSSVTLPSGVRFGPYCGERINRVNSVYCWQLNNSDNKLSQFISAEDSENSNWMRYVNCARHYQEQNLLAYQYRGDIYYRTIQIVPKFTELLVFYGSEYADALKIDLRKYNSKKHYLDVIENLLPASINEISNNTQTDNTQNNNVTTTFETAVYVKNDVSQEMIDDSRFIDEASIITDDVSEPMTLDDISSSTNDQLIPANQRESVDSNLETYHTNDKTISKNLNQIENSSRRHENIHGKNMRFNCSHCHFKTDFKHNFVRHMSLHTGKYEYNCKQCLFKGNSKRNFQKHLQMFHDKNTKLYNCTYCPYKTDLKYNFIKHMSSHTGQYEYYCELCSFKGNAKQNFQRHLNKCHGNKQI